MENKYQEGKIYKIVCNITGEVYIGSTIDTLQERLRKHTTNDFSVSRYIIERGDYKIEHIKDYPCNSKKELEEEESKYIRNNKCINVVIPNRTKKEWTEDNKEKVKQYKQKYKEKNREQTNKKQKEKITCECGSIIRKNDISTHRRTKKHIKLLEEKSM